MAVFEINGSGYDDLQSAIDACREIWSDSKRASVTAQKIEALSKVSQLDRERAELGMTVSGEGGQVSFGVSS